MSYLALAWMTVGVVVVLWLYLAWRHRDARLDRLVLPEGEELCFDDDQARFAVLGKNRKSAKPPRFRGAVVRLTSKRLFVAEPVGPVNRLRWVVYHTGPAPEGAGNAWSDGYGSFSTSPAHIGVELDAERRCLRIRPDSANTGPAPAQLAIQSPRLGEYLPVLGRSRDQKKQ